MHYYLNWLCCKRRSAVHPNCFEVLKEIYFCTRPAILQWSPCISVLLHFNLRTWTTISPTIILIPNQLILFINHIYNQYLVWLTTVGHNESTHQLEHRYVYVYPFLWLCGYILIGKTKVFLFPHHQSILIALFF